MTEIDRRRWLAGAGFIAAAALASPAGAESGAARSARRPARLSLNENNFGPSPRVARAIRTQLDNIHPYVDQEEVDALAAQVAAFERVPTDQVIIGEILEDLGAALAGPARGGEIVYSSPGYTALIDGSRALGGVGVPVPLNENLQNDLPALQAAINPRTLALSLIDPHNPSGTTNERVAYDRFILEASQRTLVVVDEAYLEYDDIGRSAVRRVRDGANVLVFRTLSKAYGLAGLSIGYALGPRALIVRLKENGVGAPHAQSRLTLAAASAALADQDHLRRIVAQTTRGRDRLLAALDGLRLRRTQSRANFVFFESSRPAADVRAALAQRGIIVGRAFPPLDAWIRISVGTSAETDRVIAALRDIYA